MRGLQPLNQPGRRALSLLLLGLVVFTLVACRRASQVRLTERDETLSLHHADRERSFILHRPTAAASGTARPLLIVMHGGGGDARGIIDITRGRFNELADAENFYVVYPQGVDKSWNDGRVDVRSTAHKENIDDVGFLKQMIETIAANHTIDRTRVFATGISNGGFMSYRLACELSGTVRAVAPVTAQLSKDLLPDCKPNQPVGVLMINGTLDPLVPYDGGTVEVFWTSRGEIISTDDTLKFWAAHNTCAGEPIVTELPDRDPADETRVDRVTYARCVGAPVALLRVRGGCHTWPGGQPFLTERLVGKVSNDIVACDEIWNFFRSM